MANFPSILDSNISTANPFRAVAKMQRQMDRLFDRNIGPEMNDLDFIPNVDLTFLPACDLNETDSHYVMSFDMPGVKKDDLKVELRGHTLTVSG